eukprot:5898429-Alexandrium_andersonii.AAC.1
MQTPHMNTHRPRNEACRSEHVQLTRPQARGASIAPTQLNDLGREPVALAASTLVDLQAERRTQYVCANAATLFP